MCMPFNIPGEKHDFMPEEMKFSPNEGVYGAKPDVIVDMPSKKPPVQRARRRRKSSDEDELEERERRKFVFDASDPENQGCGSLPLNVQPGCQKWLISALRFLSRKFTISITSGVLQTDCDEEEHFSCVGSGER